ncbi:cell division protein PerM [Actinoplanes sp. CA-015351]|uniref:cell division protein PerM n=1 Tax=Actinoplanes sp. CA-015351 TaxID=3239897 RepID=UPI003D96C54A
MPSTTDRPDGSEDPFAVAEALPSVVRDTEAVEIDRDRPARDTVIVDDELLGRRDTVRLPSQRRPAAPPKRAPMAVAAAFATLWAALLSYLPIAAVIGLARTVEGAGGLGGAAKAGLAGWLLGHGLPIGTSIGPLAVTPLLLTLLIIWRLNRAGLHVTRAVGARRTGSIGKALAVAGAIALAYALVGALAAVLADGRGTQISAGRAALHFFVIGIAGALIGSLRGTDALVALARRSPPVLRHALRAGLVAAFLILGAGAVAGGLSVALGGGQAAEMIAAYQTGVAGQAGITLISIGYAVNASVWAAAYLLGPGFALGTSSAISITEVSVGPLPMLPLVAGLPEGPVGAAGTALLLLPVIAGAAAGWLLTQRLRHGRGDARRTARRGGGSADEPPWSLLIGAGVLAGPVAGLTLGVFAWLSGGSLGAGRLSQIGPDPLAMGVVGAIVAGVSIVIGAAVARMFRPSSRRANR